MKKVAIIGSTGYVGSELIRILSKHKDVKIQSITSNSYIGKNFDDIYENFRGSDLICQEENIQQLAEDCDAIFLALPHGLTSKLVNEEILNKTKIIDLGADFRIKDVSAYETWYETIHNSPNFLSEAVYGLTEINRENVKKARLLANPGCYTTCSILALYPLLKENMIDAKSIIIDAKSGVTGAGRGVSLSSLYCEVNESIKAYKLASHRHTPEIEQELSLASGENIKLTFTPHLVPMNRGILATSYANLKENFSYSQVKSVYEKYYGNEFFIRLTKENIFPETKWVKGSNFVDIGFKIDDRTNRIIAVSALDNVVKGAAGQAIQNMNVMFGFNEKEGLSDFPIFPA